MELKKHYVEKHGKMMIGNISDQKEFSLFLKVKIEKDLHIDLNLTKYGFEIIKTEDNDFLDVVNETKTSQNAKKRIKNAYIIPVKILSVAIEFCILIVGIFLIINGQYTKSTIVFALAIFWVWLNIKCF